MEFRGNEQQLEMQNIDLQRKNADENIRNIERHEAFEKALDENDSLTNRVNKSEVKDYSDIGKTYYMDAVEEAEVAEDKAEEVMNKFQSQDKISSDMHNFGTSRNEMADMENFNGKLLSEIKNVKADTEAARDEVYAKIANMHMSMPGKLDSYEYKKLCEKYNSLNELCDRLDYAAAKTDANNFYFALDKGKEYQWQGKQLEKEDISQTFDKADNVLKEKVSGHESVMDAYKVGQKIKDDVLPELDQSIRKIAFQISAVDTMQEKYLREHRCTHEEAMRHPDGKYADNENRKKALEAEKSEAVLQMTQAVEKATALQEQIPVKDSNCTIKVIDNKNGTITIEESWDNGGAEKSKREGKYHTSEATLYKNATERKETITIGTTNGEVYAKQNSFQYRGIGYKHEYQVGNESLRGKNVFEAGLFNANASLKYERGKNGKLSRGSVDFAASLAQMKDTFSVIRNSKEYKLFSAEVALLQCKGEAKVENGMVSAKFSKGIAGGSASIGIGDLTLGKVSGSIGEVSKSVSSLDVINFVEEKARAVLGGKVSQETSSGSKEKIETKASASLGNNIALYKVSVKNDEGKKVESDLLNYESIGDVIKTVSGVKKDINTFSEALNGKLGKDISQKGETVMQMKPTETGNSDIKESEINRLGSTVSEERQEIRQIHGKSLDDIQALEKSEISKSSKEDELARAQENRELLFVENPEASKMESRDNEDRADVHQKQGEMLDGVSIINGVKADELEAEINAEKLDVGDDKTDGIVLIIEKLNKIKDEVYERRDFEGNITLEAKEQLVKDMKQAYGDTSKEERGNILVPEKSDFLKDPPIAENKNTGERYDDINYDWPKNGGFEGKPEEVTPRVGDKFDRIGAENGRYVAPMEGDTPQPVEKRALPYHFIEDSITDEPSYHSYEVDRDFGQLQDAINEYNNPNLLPEENEFMREEFQKEYDRNNWPSDDYTHEPGKTYYGNIAEAFDGGGGTQLELPMAVESLKELGMIHEL